jgi:hypothetical protein
MNMKQIQKIAVLILFGVPSNTLFADVTAAQTVSQASCDVLEVQIEPARGIETPEERVQRLEQALHESLNAYDECLTTLSSSSAASNNAASNSVASGSAEGTGAGSGEFADSTSGEKKTASDTESANVAAAESAARDNKSRGSIGASSGSKILENGSVPKDIPPGDDDDIVAQQIREAAISEPNPDVKERLWADYRKYKGLPPQ